MSHPPRLRLSLGALLAIAFGGLLAVAVGSVLVVSLGGAGRNTGELLADKADLILSSIEDRLRQHLGAAVAQAEYLKLSIEEGRIDVADPKVLEAALRGALAATPQVTGIGFVTADYKVARAERADGTFVREDWSERPEMISVLGDIRAGKGASWGEPVWSGTLGEAVIPYRAPVWRAGQFVGLFVSVIQVSEMSRYLAAISTSLQRPFVLLGRDEVLAHPSLADGHLPASRARPLPLLSEVDDRVLQAVWSPERRTIRMLLRPRDQAHTVTFADDYFVYIHREIAGFGEKPWIVGAAMPGSQAGQEAERLRKMLFVSLGLLLASVLAAIFLGRRIARPMRDLVAVADAVRTLDFGKAPTPRHSRIKEIDSAGQALSAMLAALRWFELYLPKRLVHRLVRHGDGDVSQAFERHVTVMFTDLRGFTRTASRLSPAQTASYLNDHFALLGACVEAEGGTIDKYIGDSMMAFWGAPEQQADHVIRACRAARAIAVAVTAENGARQAQGLDAIRMRVGISTGPALVGNIGAPTRINYTLVGDAVNIAQRLEQLGREFEADGDVITLITEDCYACFCEHGSAAFVGRREVRDRDGAIGMYRLT